MYIKRNELCNLVPRVSLSPGNEVVNYDVMDNEIIHSHINQYKRPSQKELKLSALSDSYLQGYGVVVGI